MSQPDDIITAEAGSADAGVRLDRFLAAAWPDYSRARISRLIQNGEIQRADSPDSRLTPSDKVRAGERFLLKEEPPRDATPAPEAIPLSVAFEDDAVIVIDKAAGMTVHPAPGQETGTLVNALLAHCGSSLSGVGGVRRPGIVHRIDKDTSGLLVVAKDNQAHGALAAQFAAHDVEREYLAFVWGAPAHMRGTIETTIGRDRRDRKRMAAGVADGKHAVTHYRMRAIYGAAAGKAACRLETGRTHQIRVHMAHIGHPLIGDPAYGGRLRGRLERLPASARPVAAAFPRQALHAATLGFVHPRTGERLSFSSSMPSDMQDLERALDHPDLSLV